MFPALTVAGQLLISGSNSDWLITFSATVIDCLPYFHLTNISPSLPVLCYSKKLYSGSADCTINVRGLVMRIYR